MMFVAASMCIPVGLNTLKVKYLSGETVSEEVAAVSRLVVSNLLLVSAA